MSSPSKTLPTKVILAYAFFGLCAYAVYRFVAGGEFSSILTLSVIFQCLSVVFLILQSLSSGSASGISARALTLEALALVCRLSSTLWLNGYLPFDASGDYMYQAFDVITLGLVLWLIHRVVVVQWRTYQAKDDSLPVGPIVVASLVLAGLLHADMNDRPIFDTLWMASLFMGILAVLPQLWLISKSNGQVEALTSHYIGMMAFSRLLSGTFMWETREDITCAFWVQGYNHAVWAILAAHVLHLILLGDFAYYYVKSLAAQGFTLPLRVDTSFTV